MQHWECGEIGKYAQSGEIYRHSSAEIVLWHMTKLKKSFTIQNLLA